MKIAYADPPYVGCAHLYRRHPDYAGEVDHALLIAQLAEYDGWILHSHVPGLAEIAPMVPRDVRVCAWVKSFAAFKPNVPVAYAWEPVFVRAARKPVVSDRLVLRDWFQHPIAMQRGLVGAKPEKVCWWLFEVAGLRPDDDLVDLFPGTGAVTRAFQSWRKQLVLPMDIPNHSDD